MKVLDGNILIYAVNADLPQHAKCHTWLSQALTGPERIGFNWIAISGFLRVSTHPRVFRQPLTVAEATQHVQRWLDMTIVGIVEPRVDYWHVLKDTLLKVGQGGNLTTDAHLAALAISHHATLVSCDTDFARFAGLKWENPLANP